MSHKPSYDPSELSSGFEAEAWEAHALRKAVEYDVYGSKTTFRVRVLSRPNNISKEDYQAIFGSDTVVVASGTDFKRYMFKGRLETEEGVPSPHRPLPDPCTMATSTDPECAARIISWHTTFVSGDSVVGPQPEIGDIVKVTLAPGDLGKYNLQYATFDKVESQVANPGAPDNSAACAVRLTNLFESFGSNATSLGSSGPRAAGDPGTMSWSDKKKQRVAIWQSKSPAYSQYNNTELRNGELSTTGLLRTWRGAQLVVAAMPDWKRLVAAYSAKFPQKTLTPAQGYRTYDGQVNVRMIRAGGDHIPEGTPLTRGKKQVFKKTWRPRRRHRPSECKWRFCWLGCNPRYIQPRLGCSSRY